MCQDDPDLKRLHREQEPRQWIYAIEPRDYAMGDVWMDLPEQFHSIPERLMLEKPPNEVKIPSSILRGHRHHANIEHNWEKTWLVVENDLQTANRTAVVQVKDQKIRRSGLNIYVYFRWFLKSDASFWKAGIAFAGDRAFHSSMESCCIHTSSWTHRVHM